jgi:GntR family transcriptional regulator, transcriptional repressor for pyruvate dehydrogenase complex
MAKQAILESERVRARHLTDEVAKALSLRIEQGEFVAGQRLPTADELARNFGVSRTVVREAMAWLKADGLVETRQGSGAFVAPNLLGRPFRIDPGSLTTPAAVLALFELRMGVETEAASLAARHRTDLHMVDIRVAMEAMKAAISRGADAVEEDLSFHKAIATATGNALYILFTDYLGRHYRASMLKSRDGLGAELTATLNLVAVEHEAVYRAIELSDPEAAATAMRGHLTDGRQRMLEHIGL